VVPAKGGAPGRLEAVDGPEAWGRAAATGVLWGLSFIATCRPRSERLTADRRLFRS